MYVDTSKNEDTWCGMLGEYISRIQYNLESIQKVVVLIIFHTYRNADDNLYVRYLYFNEGHWKQDNNYLTMTSMVTTLRVFLQLSSFLLHLVGEFCFVSCPFQPPSILPTSSIG